MSHKATNWAFEQEGIEPALMIVLLRLADCHNPDFGGAFPSQERLAGLCKVSRSALNIYLDQLEELGLIARERRRKPGSTRQDRTRYYFPFEPLFAQFSSKNLSPDSGHRETDAESRNGQKPSPENDESRVQNLDRNPVREPVRETVRRKEARETEPDEGDDHGDEEENSKSLERRVKAMEIGRNGNPWPGALGSSTQWAASQFAKLSPGERVMAEEKRDEYLVACHGKPVSLGVYFRDRKFLDVAAARKAPGVAGAGGKVPAAMFGAAWCAARTLALLQGARRVELPQNIRQIVIDTYARMSDAGARRYAQGKCLTIGDSGALQFPADFEVQEMQRRQVTEGFPEVNRLQDPGKAPHLVDARYAALKDQCEAVPIHSAVWEDWRRWHEDHFYPWLPDTGGMPVVWFPAGGPGGISAFEEHAKEVFNGRD